MTVTPRTRADDERFLENARILSDFSAASGDGFALLFFAVTVVYIFARAIWEAIRDLRKDEKPEKKGRVTKTPKHYPK